MMKIAYITHTTSFTDGSTKALYNIVKGMQDRNVDVVVITPDKEGIYSTWKSQGVKTIAVDYRQGTLPPLLRKKDYPLFIPRLAGRIYLAVKAVQTLRKIFEEESVDIVHTNTSILSIGYLAAKQLGIPHVFHVREYGKADFKFVYLPSYAKVRKRMLDSYTICITRDIQKYHRLSTSNDCSRVIYDGVLNSRVSMPQGTHDSWFLYAGRIEPAKGIDKLLRAYADYTKNISVPIPLYVAGSCLRPVFMSQLEQYVTDNGLQDHVKFLGPRKDMDFLYANAKAVVVASEFEGFGFVTTEAMFNGCIVIGRNTSGTKEQFDNALEQKGKDVGFRFSTEKQLTDMLLNVHGMNETDTAEMRESAFNVVNALYSVEKSVGSVYDFYCDILSK